MSVLARSSIRGTASSLARGYATAANVVGGVKVAGFDNAQPTTSVTVAIKAGSRYESVPGVAHALKNFAFKSTASGSALKIVRETELYGGILSSTLTREHLLLNAEFLRGDEQYFLNLLSSVLSSTKFTPYEFSELVAPTIQSDSIQAAADPSVLALDLAHQLAFRRGLGNSLFASAHSPITAEQVKNYAAQAFAKGNIAVVGTGISTEALSKAVSAAFGSGSASASGSSMTAPGSTYFGGEQRVPLDTHASPSSQPTVVIAYGTTSAASPEIQALPHLLGGSSPLKWAPGVSPLSLAADKVAGGSARSFLLPYSDATLFGVVVSAPTSEAVKSLATEVASILKQIGSNVTEEDAKRAVAQAKFAAASASDTKEGLIATAAPQLLSDSGSLKSASELIDSFSSVSASSVSKAAAELLKSKPTVVAIGDLHVLPYADELNL